MGFYDRPQRVNMRGLPRSFTGSVRAVRVWLWNDGFVVGEQGENRVLGFVVQQKQVAER